MPSTTETLTTVLSFHPKALASGVTNTTKLSCHLTNFLTFLLLTFKIIPNVKLKRHVMIVRRAKRVIFKNLIPIRFYMPKPKKKPWLAGLLSFLVAGMGQIYNKQYKKGFLLLIFSFIFIILAFTINPWFGIINWAILIYAVYDAYKTAKRTIAEEPYRNAVWITVIIYIIIFIGFLSGFWAGFTSVSEKQVEIQSKLDEFEKINNQFLSKLNEATLSLRAGDTVTARNRISETKLLLTEASQKLKSLCSWFSEKELLSEFERGLGAPCNAFIDIYELCSPKLLDSYYTLTYVYDNAKKLRNNEITKEDYVSFCNSWLNDYNVVRGTCNTLFKKANMDTSLDDLSKICEIS